ncbi:MAG: hypothetical protein IPK82_09140 [Polyangiaceae bacterium]|nr:hypothetical protein [Polyangiaceae bacterium]
MTCTTLFTLLLLIGCSPKQACYEGDYMACTCDNGQPGFAACDVDADAYGECAYCGSVPGLTIGQGGTGGSELAAFMDNCTQNSDCETGLCFNYTSKGPKCTLPCESDTDCPSPSPGCNNKGVCKAP